MPAVLKRVDNVRKFREKSSKAATVAKAKTPFLFGEIRQPNQGTMIVVPKVSSERRDYAPLGFVDSSVILNNTLQFIPNGTLYEFGVIQSLMHMAWMRAVAGRMKSDYQYSIKIVFNNFPWPEGPTDRQREAIERAAQVVLGARDQFSGSSLANLYDPLTMPPVLLRAHQALDRAVDAAYGRRDFASEAERVAFLFDLYQRCAARSAAAPGTGQARSA